MIECPVCGRVSHHPVDVKTGWCSTCERFTGKTAEEVRAVAAEFGAAGDGDVRASILWRLERFGAGREDAFSTADSNVFDDIKRGREQILRDQGVRFGDEDPLGR